MVVAFAIAGRVDVDLTREPLGTVEGRPIYLRDVWPSMQEIDALLASALDPAEYRRVYADFAQQNPLWNRIPVATGPLYEWDPASTYIREPPYFQPSMSGAPSLELSGARALAIFGGLDHDGSHQPGRRDQARPRRPEPICSAWVFRSRISTVTARVAEIMK